MRCDVAAARNGSTLTRALQLKVCLAFSVLFYRIRLVQGWKLVKFGRYFVQFVIWVGIPSSLPFDTDVVPKSRKSIWRWDAGNWSIYCGPPVGDMSLSSISIIYYRPKGDDAQPMAGLPPAWREVMAVCRQVYGLRANLLRPGSAPEPYTLVSRVGLRLVQSLTLSLLWLCWFGNWGSCNPQMQLSWDMRGVKLQLIIFYY